MGDLHITSIPAELHDKIKARAAVAGISQRDYVLRLVEDDLEILNNEEWFSKLGEQPPMADLDSAALVREGREERWPT
jgi:hypothetical protein